MLESFTPPSFITYAIPFFFLLMLVEAILGRMKNESYFHFGDSIADLSTGILSQLSGIFLKVLGLFGYFWIYENFRLFTLTTDSVWNWILALILWDFFYYWFHRLSHEINLLWASHVIHHHSEEYNLFVALRQTSLGVFSWIFYLPMAFLGIEPWLYLAAGQINLIYQYWVHTKSIHKLHPFFEFWFSTPSHHRVHHAINPQYIDKNHGGILIIWDRIFGTFEEEKETPVYGTVKPLKSYNPLYANYHYFLELFQLSLNAKGFWNKLKVWFMPPGWYPPTQDLPERQHEIPKVSAETFEKYRPPIEAWLKRYTLIWFTLILVSSFVYLLFVFKLSNSERIFYSILITFQLLIINGILESKKWAWKLEGFRLASLFLLGIYLPVWVLGLVGLLVSVSTIYLFQKRKLQTIL
ncbi:MAG: sterol desaturase family protein [Leptospiraceae bacterium]|nr:sterol desaturase family protein [Leptospiraceae bacterium]